MKEQEIKKVLDSEVSKSAKMQTLYNEGLEVGEIAKLMGVRYNFVYNVVSNNCRKEGTEVRVTRDHGAVKASIIALIEEGKTNTEIATELRKNYSYVFKVRKDYEAAQAK